MLSLVSILLCTYEHLLAGSLKYIPICRLPCFTAFVNILLANSRLLASFWRGVILRWLYSVAVCPCISIIEVSPVADLSQVALGQILGLFAYFSPRSCWIGTRTLGRMSGRCFIICPHLKHIRQYLVSLWYAEKRLFAVSHCTAYW